VELRTRILANWAGNARLYPKAVQWTRDIQRNDTQITLHLLLHLSFQPLGHYSKYW
jgi:hypothetical protein